VWDGVVADWKTAPLRPELRAALAFIEVLTLRPDELTEADVQDAYAAGVSRDALRDAATICALFSMITRLADSLGWDVPSPDRLAARAPAMLEGGYSFAAMRRR
jgi:alkylhydroperoxidase family enzyme